MTMVVNTNVVRKTFIDLGWDNLNLSELGDWLTEAGIDPAGFLAFCKALLAAPDGLDTSNGVPGVDSGQLPYIADHLRAKGVVY